jgi:hypothetical protein
LDFAPGVGYPNRRLQSLDSRTQGIRGTTLVAVCGMLLFFITPSCLILNTLENKTENIGVNFRGAAVRSHDGIEFIERRFSGDFVSFVLHLLA